MLLGNYIDPHFAITSSGTHLPNEPWSSCDENKYSCALALHYAASILQYAKCDLKLTRDRKSSDVCVNIEMILSLLNKAFADKWRAYY